MAFGTNCKLVWKPKEGMYRNSTESITYDPVRELAYSYRWWCFVRRIKGVLVFNDYSYSSQTNNHQRIIQDLLKTMNKEYITVNAPRGINDSGRINEAWEHYFTEICKLEAEMSNPRTRESTNFSRLARINSFYSELFDLESIGAKPLRIREQKAKRQAHFKSELDRQATELKRKKDLKATVNLPISEILNKGAE